MIVLEPILMALLSAKYRYVKECKVGSKSGLFAVAQAKVALLRNMVLLTDFAIFVCATALRYVQPSKILI